MKKLIAVMLSLLMVLSVGMLFVSAVDDAQSADVRVTITDSEGKLAAAAEKVTVTDTDKDGKLSINDALYCAHEKLFDGGAAAGYATEVTEYGLSMTKLWGFENGYNYSYLVNNALAWNLSDPVKDGDYIAAYTFTDTKNFSDTYTFFDKVYVEETSNSVELELTLTKITFDEHGSPVYSPVPNAKITRDGQYFATTSSEGKVKLSVGTSSEDEKTFIWSAEVADLRIVPPVCRIVLNKKEEATPDEQLPTTDPTTAPAMVITDGDTSPSTVVTEAPTDNKSTDDQSTNDESTGDQSSGDSSSPKTGDVTKMWLWLLIGAFCLAGIIGAVVFYKKRYGNK